MKALVEGAIVEVVLSEANLLALLHKLRMPDSGRTIYKRIDGRMVFIRVENDHEHYQGEERGEMHPETEAFIAQNRGPDEAD